MKVDLGQKKGKITVEFASMEDLERILGTLAPGEGPVLQKSLWTTTRTRPREPMADGEFRAGGPSERAVSGVYRNTACSLLSGSIDAIASWIRCERVWRIHLEYL